MSRNVTWEIVHTLERFRAITVKWEGPVACDVETYKTMPQHGKLLGISLCGNTGPALYIPVWVYEDGQWEHRLTAELEAAIKAWMPLQTLVGHNFTYDQRWLEAGGYKTSWGADTRLMWHLSSAPAGARGYGLKEGQVELLGWKSKGDAELAQNVAGKKGDLARGDHYLADLPVLAKYACLDTYSTLALYHKLAPFFRQHDYWWMLETMMHYNCLLEENTFLGVMVDGEGLRAAHERLLRSKEGAKKRLDKQLADVIGELEQDWLDRRVAGYKREYNKTRLLAHPEEWDRFNWNSDKQKRELFYDKMGNEVLYTTPSGLPATNLDAIKQMQGEWVETYLKYEHYNTITSNFTSGYLDSLVDGRLHPGFNICGTVSYRLSGFKPYLLNAPFEEKRVMQNLHCTPGCTGLHADLAAIEPTMTAHYSQDPTLLKVFAQGLGDIYLDLALTLFPHDQELHALYDPNAPITEAVKKALKRQRNIAKVIQLAVQYTGTEHTVARNLTKQGIPTTVWQAREYVRAYWHRFRAVAVFEQKLRELNRSQGLLRNVMGRIIRVPDPEYKDLMNRFIQSSGHDVLVVWVLEIDRLRKERGVDMRPILVDCHDSTSWEVRIDQKAEGEAIFRDALANINAALELSVIIKMEMKSFQTLAGLKADE